MKYQAMGDDITIAKMISTINSFASIAAISVADAPRTLRMPISFVLCSVQIDKL